MPADAITVSDTESRMRLYRSLPSPYARRVRVVIEELGLAEQIDEIEVDPYDPPAEFLALNPLSKVPVLITEQGEALPDSNLIISYLFTRGHGLAALPSGAKRWGALRRQRSEEHTSELQSLMRISYAVFCLQKKIQLTIITLM